MEPLRAHFDKPVTITSGYRSEALCEAIGSKKTSQHAKGQAVDLEIFGGKIDKFYWVLLVVAGTTTLFVLDLLFNK